MEPVKTVEFSRLIDFNNAGHAYIQANPNERSVVTFALQKLLKHYEKTLLKIQGEMQEEINEEAEDIRVKYCEKEKETGILKEKSYGEGKNLVVKKVYTPENEKKANKEIRALNKQKDIDFMTKLVDVTKVHIVPVPPTMGIQFITAFEGFIFEPMTDDQLEAHYLAQAKTTAPANGQV